MYIYIYIYIYTIAKLLLLVIIAVSSAFSLTNSCPVDLYRWLTYLINIQQENKETQFSIKNLVKYSNLSDENASQFIVNNKISIIL